MVRALAPKQAFQTASECI